MKTILYKITVILLVLTMGKLAFAQKNLLFLSKPDEKADSALIEFLDLEGYTVNFVDVADFKGETDYATAAIYEQYDAFYVSEVIGSSDVKNFKEAGFPIPCVNTEGWALKVGKWDWLTDDATQFKQLSSADGITEDVQKMIIIDGDSWLSNQYDADYELVWAEGVPDVTKMGVTGFKLDEVVSGAIEIGYIPQDAMDGFPSIWAIPSGSTVDIVDVGEVTLPNMVIIGAIGAGLEYATVEYFDLVLNSLKWVTGDIPNALGNLEQNTNLSVWPNPTNGIVNVSFTSDVSGYARINIYDITGKLVDSKNTDFLSAGENTISIDLSGMTGAQYLYKIITPIEVLRGIISKN